MCKHGCSAAELEKEMSGLQQTLAEQRHASEEAQASALASQQQVLTEQLNQMSTASQAKDSALSLLKVNQHPPNLVTCRCNIKACLSAHDSISAGLFTSLLYLPSFGVITHKQ